jgi:hypothetical protein
MPEYQYQPAPQPVAAPAQQPVYQYQPQPAPAQPVYQQPAPAYQQPAPMSGMCVAGFVTALLGLFPFNWIFSIVGIHACKKHGKRGKGLGIFGLVWSIITTVLFCAIVGFFIFAINDLNSSVDWDKELQDFYEEIEEVVEEND